MSAPSPQPLQRTPLYELHLELGAKMVPFAGYEMPVQYPSGILAEHLHTRKAAGLFDVSHMGQVRLTGQATPAAALERLVPGDILGLAPGRQRYAQFTNEAGGILDDLMVTRLEDELFAGGQRRLQGRRLRPYARRASTARCAIEPLADRALLALQGPPPPRCWRAWHPTAAARPS